MFVAIVTSTWWRFLKGCVTPPFRGDDMKTKTQRMPALPFVFLSLSLFFRDAFITQISVAATYAWNLGTDERTEMRRPKARRSCAHLYAPFSKSSTLSRLWACRQSAVPVMAVWSFIEVTGRFVLPPFNCCLDTNAQPLLPVATEVFALLSTWTQVQLPAWRKETVGRKHRSVRWKKKSSTSDMLMQRFALAPVFPLGQGLQIFF